MLIRLILIITLIIGISNVGLCEIYKWTNDDGSIGFTDDLSNVPEKYRNQVEMKKYRSYETEGNDDTGVQGDYNEKTVKEESVSENEEELKHELSEEEKRKIDEELRGIWGNMKKALKKKRIE